MLILILIIQFRTIFCSLHPKTHPPTPKKPIIPPRPLAPLLAEASFPGAFFVSFLCRHKEMKRGARNV